MVIRLLPSAFIAVFCAAMISLDASVLTSGQLAVARGGTGVDGSAAPVNQALMGTGTGYSVRALTSTDVPNLDTSKLTSGTLGVARGGTGAAATPTNGQLPIGNGSVFVAATPTTGNGLSWTTGSGTLALSTAGVDGNGLGLQYTIKTLMSAVGNSTDVTIYSANAPFAFTVLDSFFICTNGVTSGTVQLRDATGGGGNAVSSAMGAVAAGLTRNAQTTAPATIAANGTLVLRHAAGNGNITGTVIVSILRN